jgi:magnesium chelatase subunit H
MPGKQTGLTESCWPERLIGSVPNLYLYAGNNPSEGTIAKRRSAATLVSYLTPSLTRAGLYRGLLDLKGSLDRWRQLDPDSEERGRLAELIQAQAAEVDLAEAEPTWGDDAAGHITGLVDAVTELEHTLIPEGLHIVGETSSPESRVEQLLAMGEASRGVRPDADAVAALVDGATPEQALRAAGIEATGEALEQMRELAGTAGLLAEDHELPALLRALDGRFIRPAPGGDLLHNPDILPTGRNLHGFDPFRLPSVFALSEGRRQADKLLDRHKADGHGLPESIALVLWGTDNLKSEGNPIAQALALMGAQPRFDGYGRLSGASLITLEELGRPRIDVVMTLSGIFRDLLPLQTRMLAEAAWLAASAEEPPEHNFVRRNALAYQREHDCDLETAALRVFSNADGTYGSNVNYLLDSGRWDNEDELAETYTRRKCYAYGRDGRAQKQSELLEHTLAGVQLSYQNLDSVELGVTTINHYFDTLGGISRAVQRASGDAVPVYIGDQTRGEGKVRTLGEQVALETRTRMLNPKWHEGMLSHGYEGVRQIEEHVTNTLGWSATTGQVAPWVYQRISQTFVLDDAMRERLGRLNPAASARMANRLLEAQERSYWSPDEETLEALRRAGAELEDRLEGIDLEATA